MSKQAVEEILRKASADTRFRSRLKSDFAAATKGYKLTAAEQQQLRTGATVKAASSKKMPRKVAAEELMSELQ